MSSTGVQFIGQTQGLINDVPSVEAIVQRILQEAAEAHMKNGTHFDSSDSIERQEYEALPREQAA
jgi:hypothetical protein